MAGVGCVEARVRDTTDKRWRLNHQHKIHTHAQTHSRYGPHSTYLHTDCGQIIINSSSYTVGEGGLATFLSCPTQIPRVYVVMYLFW